MGPSRDWLYLLTEKQHRYLRVLSGRFAAEHGVDAASDDACVFDLGQSDCMPRLRARGVLPTIRASTSKFWSPSRRRWLLQKECLSAMGFPVYRDLAQAAEMEVDVISATAARYSVGNAMHVANVGSVLAFALLATTPR